MRTIDTTGESFSTIRRKHGIQILNYYRDVFCSLLLNVKSVYKKNILTCVTLFPLQDTANILKNNTTMMFVIYYKYYNI